MISTIAGTESRTWPKNSRHTVRIARGIVCRMKRAEVMIPSQPSFCTPGRPARNLSVTSLPSPSLRNCRPGISSTAGSPSGVRPSVRNRRIAKRAVSASWIFPRLWPTRVTSRRRPSGSTIRHDARLSSAVPQRTAFLPPAFIATFPPMHEASAEVGSTANTWPAASAASITRRVTTPAPHRTVGTVPATPGSATCSTGPSASSFSVLITAARGVRGIAPPVYPVPPPRGMIVSPSAMQSRTTAATSSSVSGATTTKGTSTRQSVASVTCATRARPSNWTLSRRVLRASRRSARRRRSMVSSNPRSNASTAARARSSRKPTFASRAACCARTAGSAAPSASPAYAARRLSISASR